MQSTKVLIVEDEVIVGMDIQCRLKKIGYTAVGPVVTGEDAVARAERELADLVLMDINLPGDIDGITAARRIHDRLDIPVVFLTAYSDEGTLQQAKHAEPAGYLVKPFNERELHATIEMALYKHTMDKKLREVERRLATTLASIGDAVIATDAAGVVNFMNPVAESVTRWPANQAAGMPLSEVFNIIDSDSREHLENPVSKVLRNNETVHLSNHAVLISKDRGEIAIEDSAAPIKDDNGNVSGVVLVFRDVTERHRVEEALRQAEDRLRQSQKMEAIGRLAGGVAHDFNNLLTAIIGHSQLVTRKMSPDDPMRNSIIEIEKAGQRAASLTAQLLAFSRKQILRPKVLDLNAVVTELEIMLRRLIGEDIAVQTRLSPSLGLVKADPGQIEQVIMNLAINARDAMPAGGVISIETANESLEGPELGEDPELHAGEYVTLAITDTGRGMDQETQARLFEPFFTTKAQGKGTGLGLATVYGIVDQSGGQITVDSEPGRGTTFKIYLPRAVEHDAQLDEPVAIVPSASPAQGKETILLVEDEEAVRTLTRRILEQSGYCVLEAKHGPEALLLCAQYEGAIHLMITDVVMPEMSGRQLTERVAPTRPDMKILLMSGYTEDTMVRHGIACDGAAFLQKPFTLDALGLKVREVLDS